MDKSVSSSSTPQAVVDYETALEQLLEEIQHLNDRMSSDRREIEQLKAESRALRTETRALLSSMGAAL